MARPTRVLVLRHGQSEGNVSRRLSSAAPGTPLTDLGRQQAREAGLALRERFGPAGVAAVVASPLLRAQQTARLVADVLGVADVGTLDGVREFGLGALEGAETEEAWGELDEVYARWRDGELEVGAGGDERAADVVERVSAALEQLVDRHAGAVVVVVSHGGAMELALPRLARAAAPTRSRAVPNAGAVELLHDGAGWQLVGWPAAPRPAADRVLRHVGRADALRGTVGATAWARVGGALCSTLPVPQPWATTAAYTGAAEPPSSEQLAAATAWCAQHAPAGAGSRVSARGEHRAALEALGCTVALELQVLTATAVDAAGGHGGRDVHDALDGAPAVAGVDLAEAADPGEFLSVYGAALAPLVEGGWGRPGMRFLVAREAGRAVGCARVWDVGQTAYVSAVAVLPEARGRGIGTALSAAATRLGLARHPLVWLTCEEHLVPLYGRLGFTVAGTHLQLTPPTTP